jgi:three-Cys-motif partner protein
MPGNKLIRYDDLRAEDDGFFMPPPVGSWAEEKYRHFWTYADLFSTSMKKKWHKRVYIDLFCAAGKSRNRDTGRVLYSSPLLALKVNVPFDCHVFCDNDPRCIEALDQRVRASHPDADVIYLRGDANTITDRILAGMPPFGPGQRVLGFCFADPFRLQDLQFSTIRALAVRYIDFLIHIPAGETLRNEGIYLDPACRIVDNFLGKEDWRGSWRALDGRMHFDLFVTNLFCDQMSSLGYRGRVKESVLVRSTQKNLPLYRLGFFSRSELGERFWGQTKKYSKDQLELF